MTLSFAIFVLFALGSMVALHGWGYANCIDSLAFWLHRHARLVRKMHEQRTAVMSERWTRTLESSEEL